MDQASTNIISLMYDIYFNRTLDYVEILYQEIREAVMNKVVAQEKGNHLSSLIYTRFIPLILQNAIEVKDILCSPSFCKFHTLKSHHPIILDEGYPEARPLSRYMQNLSPHPSSYLELYRRSEVFLAPRSLTPKHLVSRIVSEGSSEHEHENNQSAFNHAERLFRESTEDAHKVTNEGIQLSPTRATTSTRVGANTPLPIETGRTLSPNPNPETNLSEAISNASESSTTEESSSSSSSQPRRRLR